MQRKTKSIMTEAQKIETMFEALSDPITLKGMLPELEEKLKDAARRTPDVFDSILFYGAARLYLKGGADAVRQEFRRRYGTEPVDKAVSLGEMVKYKQRAAIERAKEARRKAVADDAAAGTGYNKRPGAGLSRLPSRDPRFLIPDDAARLEAKRAALNVPQWFHDASLLNISLSKIERAYDGALNAPKAKSTDPVIQRDLNRITLIEAGVPEVVLDLYHKILGDDDFTRVLAALVMFRRDMKMFGIDHARAQQVLQKAERAMTGLDQSKATKVRNTFWRTEYEPK